MSQNNPDASIITHSNKIITSMMMSGFTEDKAKQALIYYEEFLKACATTPKALAPTTLVDAAWHAHMESAEYDQDCKALCGRVIPHQPGVYGTAEWTAAWSETRSVVAYPMDQNPFGTGENAGTDCFRPWEV
jgi:hypothetical protein